MASAQEQSRNVADAHAANTIPRQPLFPLRFPVFTPALPSYIQCIYPTVAPSLGKLSNQVTTLFDALGRLEHRLAVIGGDELTPRPALDPCVPIGNDDGDSDVGDDADGSGDDSPEDSSVTIKVGGGKKRGKVNETLKPHEILQTIAGLHSVLERLDERTKVLVERQVASAAGERAKALAGDKMQLEREEDKDEDGNGLNESQHHLATKGALIADGSAPARSRAKRQKHQDQPAEVNPMLAMAFVAPSPPPPPALWTIASSPAGITIQASVQNLNDLSAFLQDFKKLGVNDEAEADENGSSSSPSPIPTKNHLLTDSAHNANQTTLLPTDNTTVLHITPTKGFGKEAIIEFNKDGPNLTPGHSRTPNELATQSVIKDVVHAYFEYRCCHQQRTVFLERDSFYREHYGSATLPPVTDPSSTPSLLLIYSMCVFSCKKFYRLHPPATNQNRPWFANQQLVVAMEDWFYEQSRTLLAECFDTPSLAVIQALIHLHYFECFRKNHKVAYMLIGMAIRIAFDLRLFRTEEADEAPAPALAFSPVFAAATAAATTTATMAATTTATVAAMAMTTATATATACDSPRSPYSEDSLDSSSTLSSLSSMTRAKEERRLTTFKLLFLDLFSAFHAGEPSVIDDREWDRIPLHRKRIELSITHEPCEADPARLACVQLFLNNMTLMRVQKRIMAKLYSPEAQDRAARVMAAKTGTISTPNGPGSPFPDDEDEHLVTRTVNMLHGELTEWYRQLPDYFVFDPQNPDANPTFPPAALPMHPPPYIPPAAPSAARMRTLCRLVLHQFYQLNRIFLYQLFIPTSADDQSVSSVDFLEMCLDAARSITQLTEMLVEEGSCFINLQSVFFAGMIYVKYAKLYIGDPAIVAEAEKGLLRCAQALRGSLSFRFELDLCQDYVVHIEEFISELKKAVATQAQEQMPENA
ncbi:hypothetical protein BC936DRAFT_145928 [Jimgerdemannia flammicorona]|uniref:Xylanolytic transcriptional activator regulatory domain-containing protein n=1 Tax=Jimgerdemannia flammicorona TaxID=994334 RepID=A0A433D8R1_9FUNG|nr:hypothetical protein BC936DRAFT_145928 [Jimgerdemannia flammicorona]